MALITVPIGSNSRRRLAPLFGLLGLAVLAVLALAVASRSSPNVSGAALLAEGEASTLSRPQLNASACLGNASTGYVCEPTFYIYGASKCATSSVARYLAAHPRVAFEALRAGCGPGLVAASMADSSNCNIVPEEGRIDDNLWPPLGVPCDVPKRGGHSALFNLAACRRYFLEEHGLRQSNPGAYLVGNNKPANLYVPTGGERVQLLFPGPAAAKRFVVWLREPAKRTWSSFNFHENIWPPRGTVPRVIRCMDENGTPTYHGDDQPIPSPNCTMRGLLSVTIPKRLMLENCLAAAAGSATYEGALDLPAARAREVAATCHSFYSHALSEHLDKSIYHDQLVRLAQYFPRGQIFIAGLERFGRDGIGVWSMLVRFLGLQLYGADGYADEASLHAVLAVRYNSGEYSQPDPTPQEWADARAFFAPYNQKLYAWLEATDDGANTAFDRWED